MNESISRAAGSNFGQEITANELVTMIRGAGRIPVRRNTVYDTKEIFRDHDPVAIKPLVERGANDPLAFLKMFPDSGGTKVVNE